MSLLLSLKSKSLWCLAAAVWALASAHPLADQPYLPVTGPPALRVAGFAGAPYVKGASDRVRAFSGTVTNATPLSASSLPTPVPNPMPPTAQPVAADPQPIPNAPASAPAVEGPAEPPVEDLPEPPAEPGPAPAAPVNQPAPLGPEMFVQFFTHLKPSDTNRHFLVTVPVPFQPPRPTPAPSSSATYTSH